MTALNLFVTEATYRWRNLLLGLLAVGVAVASWCGTVVLLRGHDARTELYLDAKRATLEKDLAVLKDDMRKAALELSFNLLVLPKGQDLKSWYAEGEIAGSMPESYVEKLADGGIVTVRHFLPIVQKRIVWEEKGRRIILVGSRGEVPNLHMSPRKPLVQPVPPGTIVLGYELHRSLDLDPGDEVTLRGHTFTVHRCHEQRGNQDDITAWIYLDEAQEIFGMEGRVHAILALECLCAGMPGVEKFRREVAGVLPDADVIEFGTKALARAEARLNLHKEIKATLARDKASRAELKRSRLRLAAILVPVVLLVSGVALAALAATNVRHRQREFATLRAIGMGSGTILGLILLRYGLTALPGALLGCLLGNVGGAALAAWLDPVLLPGSAPLLTLADIALAVTVAVVATLAAAWIPALVAAREDPAAVLGRE